ncbi:hypothetical protein ACLOJK_030428 [Asimina triloba]
MATINPPTSSVSFQISNRGSPIIATHLKQNSQRVLSRFDRVFVSSTDLDYLAMAEVRSTPPSSSDSTEQRLANRGMPKLKSPAESISFHLQGGGWKAAGEKKIREHNPPIAHRADRGLRVVKKEAGHSTKEKVSSDSRQQVRVKVGRDNPPLHMGGLRIRRRRMEERKGGSTSEDPRLAQGQIKLQMGKIL